MITKLADNEIFVFGSNALGMHAGGAAKTAFNKFGALWGHGRGSQGQSWGIITLDGNMEKVSLQDIAYQVGDLLDTAQKNPHKRFLVTKIGCGIAGFSEEEIAPLFKGAPVNVILPEGWIKQ